MKGLIGLVFRTVGAKRLLGMVWDMVDDSLKAHVAKTSNEFDDEALKVVDQFIKSFVEA